MTAILSQSEMDSLLVAHDYGPMTAGWAESRRTGCGPAPHAPLGAESIDSIRTLHECFVGELSASLSNLLRCPVDVKFTSVEQLTYGEHLASVEHPACLHLIQTDPLRGSWLLEWSGSIAFPIIDRLLGGGGTASHPTPRRPLTEIECRLLSRVTERAAAALQTAWTPVGHLTPTVTRSEGQNAALPFAAPDAAIVLVRCEISTRDASGGLSLCLPCSTLAPLEDRLVALASKTEHNDGRKQIARPEVGQSCPAVELVVQLASTRLTADEVANLAVGDVIVTDCDQDQAVAVRIDGESRFTGHAGVVKGRKAVRIGSALLAVNGPHPASPPIVVENALPASAHSEFTERD